MSVSKQIKDCFTGKYISTSGGLAANTSMRALNVIAEALDKLLDENNREEKKCNEPDSERVEDRVARLELLVARLADVLGHHHHVNGRPWLEGGLRTVAAHLAQPPPVHSEEGEG